MSTHRYVARVTLEFTTPFLIGTGRGGDVADAVCVSDPNGLPALPGSSLAGVLRAACQSAYTKAVTDDLFGFQERDQGAGSRLTVSWACIHDCHNVPVEGLVPPERLNDDVLAKALLPAIRDHVRINHRGAGAADDRAKFDEQAVCAGQRFTFELALAGNADHQVHWENLLTLLGNPDLRLGGKTRRGFGAFRIQALRTRVFDLSTDFAAYQNHPVRLAGPDGELHDTPLNPGKPSSLRVELHLRPQSYWMFGGGVDLTGATGNADMAPVRDSRVVWKNDCGRVEEDLLLIPATGLKGALAHRVAFHYNALMGDFADQKTASTDSATQTDEMFYRLVGENNPAVGELFGYCKDSGVEGQRGRVIIDDQFLTPDPPQQLVPHVGIDRFTGGARDGVLFSERPLWQGPELRIPMRITRPEGVSPETRKALALALADLAGGRLQVGGGHGRGLGYFKGEVIWPEGENWDAV